MGQILFLRQIGRAGKDRITGSSGSELDRRVRNPVDPVILSLRFSLHLDGDRPGEVRWTLRFRGTGRLDCRVGHVSSALERMRCAACATGFLLRASAGAD
jgi:hypothetical protein